MFVWQVGRQAGMDAGTEAGRQAWRQAGTEVGRQAWMQAWRQVVGRQRGWRNMGGLEIFMILHRLNYLGFYSELNIIGGIAVLNYVVLLITQNR